MFNIPCDDTEREVVLAQLSARKIELTQLLNIAGSKCDTKRVIELARTIDAITSFMNKLLTAK